MVYTYHTSLVHLIVFNLTDKSDSIGEHIKVGRRGFGIINKGLLLETLNSAMYHFAFVRF